MKGLNLKKVCARVLFGVLIFFVFSTVNPLFLALAADPISTQSILPEASATIDCKSAVEINPDIAGSKNIEDSLKGGDQSLINNILGCGIKTGNIKLYMVPYYVRAVLEFVIGISGLICVGGIIFGGYWYLFAGVSEDKEKGKKAILYGLVGMVLTLVSWALVNIIIGLLTM